MDVGCRKTSDSYNRFLSKERLPAAYLIVFFILFEIRYLVFCIGYQAFP